MDKVRNICQCCGKAAPTYVACSALGAISYAYCAECLSNWQEPYHDLVVTAALCDYPDGASDAFMQLVDLNLEYRGKTREEFMAAVQQEIINEVNSIDWTKVAEAVIVAAEGEF
jgi:hypothetical protein